MLKLKKYISLNIIIICCIVFVGCKKEIVAAENQNKSTYNNLNIDLINYLKNTTNVPIYLPTTWIPMVNNKKYYYQILSDKNSYNISVYRTKVAVKFNDENDLLEKNGPVSEADFVGSIRGSLNDDEKLSNDIPKDAKSFKIIPGITAYEIDEGMSVWWEDKGWKFHFIGPSSYKNKLIDIASKWNNSKITISKTGNVEIVGGNKLTIYYNWKKDGYYYTYSSGNNMEENINSFTYIDPI